MWRSSSPAFAELQAFLEWYADDGKHTPCCGDAGVTIQEIRENRRTFDCQRCPHADWDRSMMAVNREALMLYRRLCGRTVVDLGLAGRLFEAATTGWSPGDVVDLVARLERIRSVLDPPRPLPNSGTG